MQILDLHRQPIELELVMENTRSAAPERALAGERPDMLEEARSIIFASRAFFLGEADGSMGTESGRAARALTRANEPGPAVLRESRTGLVRTVHREIVVRFGRDVSDARRRRILKESGLEVRRANRLVPDQVVVADPARRVFGADLIPIANRLAALDEVIFATPNFVSEYQREVGPRIGAGQWHLLNVAAAQGQVAGEDIRARGAWRRTRGKGMTVAILDDGVDLEHRFLRSRIWRNPDTTAADQVGRDFFLPNDHPDHFNPRPKKFRHPFNMLAGNDIHGTPCAGIVAAPRFDVPGIAPSARILAVKIFHADLLASDERVADAIRYAATRADVISCSWTGGDSPDVEQAIVDAGTIGRGGRGSPLFCATGNGNGRPVGFPARATTSIAVGASTDQGMLASYSNVGPEVDFVAPSSGGIRSVTATDVSDPGRGFNLGTAASPGLVTDVFGGTSAATPLAAGIGALVLSLCPTLDREGLRELLRATCDKIGAGYDASGHSTEFGFGRLNAATAVAAAIARGP